MKKALFLAVILAASVTPRMQAQQTIPSGTLKLQPQPPGSTFSARVQQIKDAASQAAAAATRFNLDFPGGTPRELADAIEKASGQPLNVIVPPEYARTQLPPIRVSDVTAPQLFDTLQTGSRRYFNNDVISSYGFTSPDNIKNDNTIWNFSVYTNQGSGPLTKFSIDFPGGTPKQLVAAIQKAMGRPLNVIIPEEAVDTKLPPLKMNDVNVNELFHALELASYKVENYVTGNNTFGGGGFRGPTQSYQQRTTSYGFKTEGKLSDDSIWYFHVDRVPSAPGSQPDKVCRFYALAPYLDHGLKVDDITTAVETGWKMSGETSPPTISFHKDTKLLIAVGEPQKLQVIEDILQALKPGPLTFPAPAKKSSDAKAQD